MSPASSSRPPRVALIGVTGYGGIYLQLVREALAKGAIRLVAAVIINRDEAKESVTELLAGGTIIYGSFDEFIAQQAGKIDLCLIPVGIQWHARLTIGALQAGMNVLVEKPLAGSLADVAAIRRAEVEFNRWVAVGFQDLYAREARWLKQQLLDGVIGRVEDVRMIGLWPRPRSYFSRNHWAGCVEADGAPVHDSPLNNAFAHFVNLALFFAGTEAHESAPCSIDSADLFRAHRIEMFDTAVVRGQSPSGTRFWFGVSHATSATRQPEIFIRGSDGQAEWWHEQRCVVINVAGKRQVFRLPSTEESRQLMFASVLARLTDPTAFICTVAIAEQHTRFIERIQEAATVRAFPASSIDWISEPDTRSEIPSVHGLADALGQAFLAGLPIGSTSPFAPAELATR